ncbi:TPA: nucleotidyltransferase domain-containing protein [Candidatus Woesearchaeota archaeon]|nr:nucleotidyltransferase domain-containing protein [Candidatus Woesearchaeota archaeon]
MGQANQKWDRIMSFFFNYPTLVISIRQLAAKVKVPKSTLQRELQGLIKEKLIMKISQGYSPGYKANEANFWYKFHKRNFLISQIYDCGLIDYLEAQFHPAVIMLFGSGAKGEYHHQSDLDIFLLASEKDVKIQKYEKKLRRKINYVTKENYTQLSPELFNNIINGYKLSGYLKLR